jgi:hypothetical protein
MSHQRTEIRNAVVALLTGATAAGTRVFGKRNAPHWEIGYPCILVYGREEAARSSGNVPAPSERNWRLLIDAFVAGDDLDTAMDDLSLEIENKIKSDPTLGRRVLSLNLIGTEQEDGSNGHIPIGGSRLTYEVTYVG